jgi:hypothetical protein
VFANAPVSRMRALRELAHREDARRLESAAAPLAATFAQVVRQRMDGPVLRYSHRTHLIREAERRGIGRFEANLIIAAVQHEAGERRGVESIVPSSSSSWIPLIVGICATQGAIFAGLWWMMG